MFKKIASLKTAADFNSYIDSLGISLPFDEKVISGPDSPLAKPHTVDGRVVGNSFAVLPMEGFDGTNDGKPSDISKRRWQRFGLSGAKLIWNEATAIRPDARGNPRQLMMLDSTLDEMARLKEATVKTHEEYFGNSNDLLVGLQLTHAGRVSKPNDAFRFEPKIIYHHPLLDARMGINADYPVLTDDEISRIAEDFIKSSILSMKAGFDFVDIKYCHGYLLHEMLSAVDRPGRYGGSFENRTRFLRDVVAGIRAKAPKFMLAVRLSAADFIPYRTGKDRVGEPVPFKGKYPYAFGGDGTGMGVDLTEPLAFLDLLEKLGIKLVSISAGGGYNVHILRPFSQPASDTYKTPEDPIISAARLINLTSEIKQKRPNMIYINAGFSYLQQWLPNVAQRIARENKSDFIGIARMILCYPEIIADLLSGKPLDYRRLCRTCSDCTTSAHNGLIAGCYAFDEFYKHSPAGEEVRMIKKQK